MNSRSIDSDVMAEIKAATRAQHEALEDHAGILERTSTANGYAGIIAVMTSMHQAYEPQIDAYAEQFRRFGLDIARRNKRALLEADRRTIRERLGIEDLRAVPNVRCRIETFAQAVGWLYVFEGSTLGGIVIAANIRRALHVQTSYYGAYGAESASMWREFREFVAAYAAGHDQAVPAIIAGAQEAFRKMHDAFTNPDFGA